MNEKLVAVKSERNIVREAPAHKILYEWEDIISSQLKIPIKSELLFWARADRFLERKSKILKSFVHKSLPKSRNLKLKFVMQADAMFHFAIDKNTIPVIIDYWLDETQLSSFFEAYKQCPLVLVTSAEVFEDLKSNNCPFPIEHWPLSIPDQHQINEKLSYDKKYEFCFLGRPNPYFKRYLDRYSIENKDFSYIITSTSERQREYKTNNGRFVMKDTGRESYLSIIRASKITCYTTPGIDESKKVTGFFNQVTPRVFEMISGGCYVVGHYTDNPDTRFYELDKTVPNIESYEDFKYWLEKYRNLPPRDLSECKDYLSKHLTSKRVPLLKSILEKHQIII
jgi:hypothetical protein